jgi:glycine cleavage system H protein
MGNANTVKSDRRYTRDHEWAREHDGVVLCGITEFAVDQLGDVTLVNLEVEPGATVTQGAPFGSVESVKTVSDLFAPVSGTVKRVNTLLADKPELINEDCWEQGWMIAIESTGGVDGLLDPTAYAELLDAAADG